MDLFFVTANEPIGCGAAPNESLNWQNDNTLKEI